MSAISHLVFTEGVGISGAITRWWTWTETGHCGFVLENGDILDATPARGVDVHNGLAGEVVGRFTVSCTAEQQSKAFDWALERVGEPYDWSAIYGMPFRKDWHKTKGWFCSEFVFAAYEAAGFSLLHEMHCNRVTPRDLRMSPCLVPFSFPR